MTLAMADAGVEPSSIDYVNLHGTSTLLNDRIETNALKLALNCNAHRIPMSGTKSQVGHPQGASVAAGFNAPPLVLASVFIHPTIKHTKLHPSMKPHAGYNDTLPTSL